MPEDLQCAHINDFYAKLASGEAVRIVGLGDSLTYGWEASFSYFDLFVARLRSDFCGQTIIGHNAGVCGDTASGGAQRVNALLSEPAHLVIVQFGINDFYANIAVEKYRESLGVIARKVIRSGGIPLFITSGPLCFADQQRGIAPYYDAIRNIAGAYDCPLADIAGYMHRHCDNLRVLYFEDGVHPNDDGYRMMSDALYTICETIKSTTTNSATAQEHI